jgi:hypothetical protein
MPNLNLDIETKVIERFIQKTKRERYLTFIQSDKTRRKFTEALAHFSDLRRGQFDLVKGDERQIIRDRIRISGKLVECYIISENSDLDQKRLGIESALNEIIGYGMGTLVVFGDAEVLYYEGEGPDNRWISKKLNKY